MLPAVMAYDPDRDSRPKDPNDAAAPDAQTSEDGAQQRRRASARSRDDYDEDEGHDDEEGDDDDELPHSFPEA